MKLTDLFIERPCLTITVQMAILFLLTFISFQLGYFDLNDPSTREYLIWDDERCVAWDKLVVAEEYLLENSGGDGNQPLQMTSVESWNPMMLYEVKDGVDFLDKENLMEIYNIEE